MWKDDEPEGRGVLGGMRVGEYKKNDGSDNPYEFYAFKETTFGTFNFADGSHYEGTVENARVTGKGVKKTETTTEDGYFKDGKLYRGTLTKLNQNTGQTEVKTYENGRVRII
jgi:hypothetical protein